VGVAVRKLLVYCALLCAGCSSRPEPFQIELDKITGGHWNDRNEYIGADGRFLANIGKVDGRWMYCVCPRTLQCSLAEDVNVRSEEMTRINATISIVSADYGHWRVTEAYNRAYPGNFP
jgi:hypothetical protein